MNPAIIFHPTERHRAHLIDKDAVAALPLRDSGDRHLHYLTAVSIQDLDAGEFRADILQSGEIITDKCQPEPGIIGLWISNMATPRPAVYVPLTPQKHIEETPGHRGIDMRAAVVLLKLAESFNNIQTERARTWKFRSAAIENEEIPWDEWRFITAWLWSGWDRRAKKPTLAQRFEELKALGYDRGPKSFEAMHRQMFPKN